MKKTIVLALAFLALNVNAQTNIFDHISAFKIGGNVNGLINEDITKPEYGLDYSRVCYNDFEYEYEKGKTIKFENVCLFALEIYSISIEADSSTYEYFKNKYGVYKDDPNKFITPSDISGNYYTYSNGKHVISLVKNDVIEIMLEKIKVEKEKEKLKEGGL